MSKGWWKQRYRNYPKMDPKWSLQSIQDSPRVGKGAPKSRKGQEKNMPNKKPKIKNKWGSGERNARGQSNDSTRLIRLTRPLAAELNTAGAPRPRRAVFRARARIPPDWALRIVGVLLCWLVFAFLLVCRFVLFFVCVSSLFWCLFVAWCDALWGCSVWVLGWLCVIVCLCLGGCI